MRGETRPTTLRAAFEAVPAGDTPLHKRVIRGLMKGNGFRPLQPRRPRRPKK